VEKPTMSKRIIALALGKIELFPKAASLIIAFAAAFSAQATVIVTPNANAITEGISNNIIPFDSGTTGLRYQQRTSASEFGVLSVPSNINAIAFRRDANFTRPAFNFNFSSITLGLSTLTTSMTNNFAANRGSDFTVVYSGSLDVSVPGVTSGIGPNPFDFVINFQTPFLYDPSQGDLLWEFQNFGNFSDDVQLILDYIPSTTPILDRLYATSPTATTGALISSGLVTRFTVPEPISLALVSLGLAGLSFQNRRKIK
jgi:hypothetical protein